MSTEVVSERTLDKTMADSFPASDPPSTLPNPSFDSFFRQSTPASSPHESDAPEKEAA
jgi:hypothetical protein